jgi:uncharacterized protein YbjQ (UPF0145 family)
VPVDTEGTPAAGPAVHFIKIGYMAPNTLSSFSLTRRSAAMIVTTTPSVEGKRIKQYLGVVTGEAILGANVFKDIFAGIRDIIGGRSASYERELRKARDIALSEIEQAAKDLGANALVGVDLDYETVGGQGSMLMVSASGTAVVLE